MKKKLPKNNKPTPEYDPLRQQNVLLEKIYSEVKTVAEGHSMLSQKIDRIDTKLEEHDNRFDRIDAKLGEHEKRFDKIDAKLGEHDKRFNRVESTIIENSKDIQLLKADVTQLKAGQGRIEQKLDTVTTDHEQRIQKLETVH